MTVTAAPLIVTLTDAASLTNAQIERWAQLRAANPTLWSPFFDLRYVRLVSQFAPKAKIAVIKRAGEIVAFFPFQGNANGLIRPLGAPLADQHGVIAGLDGPHIEDVLAAMPKTSFRFTGLVGAVAPRQVGETHEVWLADLSLGVDAYLSQRQVDYPDHFRKMARRERKAERDFGPIRVETGVRDLALFEVLLAWKRQQYRATGRHDVLGVDWISRFLKALLASNDPEFGGEIAALFLGDSLAGLEFGMRSGTVLHSWFPAYDPAFSSISPGVMVMDAMIVGAGRRGITMVDLGAGHGDYKKHVSNAGIDTFDGMIGAPSARSILTKPLHWIGSKLEQRGGRLGGLPGKFSRRMEMILASEPTLSGRMRGMVWAAQDMTRKA